MAIILTCKCGKRLKANDDAVGKKVRCPECKELNVVELERPAAGKSATTPVPKPDPSPAAKKAKTPPPKPASKAELVIPRKESGVRNQESGIRMNQEAGIRSQEAAKVKDIASFDDDAPAPRPGEWRVGDEILAPSTPDCLNVGKIQKLTGDKALIDFPQSNYSGWVFADTIEQVAVRKGLEVKCTSPSGDIRDGKVVSIQGNKVRVVYGSSTGKPNARIVWTDEEGSFDISALGVPCKATTPGAKSAHDFAFYEELRTGDRVWAPWEKDLLYPGKVAKTKDHEVLVDFENGNQGWVLLGQILPFAVNVGERLSVRKKLNGTSLRCKVVDEDGSRYKVAYEKGGSGWVKPENLLMDGVIPVGPDARITKRARGRGLAIFSVLGGTVLFLAALGLVGWNEYRAIQRAEALSQGANACIAAKADKIDPDNDGKLVHVSGDAATQETLKDDKLGFQAHALKLTRTVEIFQWTERTVSKSEKQGKDTKTVEYVYHDAKWVKNPVNSSSFKKDSDTGRMPINHGTKIIDDAVIRAKAVNLGAFQLTDAQVDHIGAGEKLPVTPEMLADAPKNLTGKLKIHDGDVYLLSSGDGDPLSPDIGDLHISFTVLKPQPVSVIARQTKETFEPSESGLDELRAGILSKEEMFEKAKEANETTTTILRARGD